MSETFFGWYSCGGGWGELLMSRRQRPGVLPSSLQCTRRLLTIQKYLAPNIDSDELKNPGLYLQIQTYSKTS